MTENAQASATTLVVTAEDVENGTIIVLTGSGNDAVPSYVTFDTTDFFQTSVQNDSTAANNYTPRFDKKSDFEKFVAAELEEEHAVTLTWSNRRAASPHDDLDQIVQWTVISNRA